MTVTAGGSQGPPAVKGHAIAIDRAMKQLLIATAAIEVGAGLALVCWPSATVVLLLGSPLDTPAAISLGRVAGAALLALGFACWLARHDEQSRAARGSVSAMVLYNLGAVLVLGAARVQLRPVGVALWPAVVLHAAMAAWCIVSLRSETPIRTPSER
jgi:hypothetical protein